MRPSRPVAVGFLAAALAIAAPGGLASEPKTHRHEALAAATAPPGDSLYQLPISLQSADGKTFKITDLRGEPLVITMFYSHCSSVCPLLTAQLQRLIGQLPRAQQQRIHVLMVSFDPTRDTPEALRHFEAEHHIQGANWIVARASVSDVRALAAALGIQYRELPDHTFNHSAIISVTDREGTVRARTSELTGSDEAFVQALRTQIGTTPPRR